MRFTYQIDISEGNKTLPHRETEATSCQDWDLNCVPDFISETIDFFKNSVSYYTPFEYQHTIYTST